MENVTTMKPQSKQNPYTCPKWGRNGTGSTWHSEYRGYSMFVYFDDTKIIHHSIRHGGALISKSGHPRREWTMNQVKQHCIDTVDQITAALAK